MCVGKLDLASKVQTCRRTWMAREFSERKSAIYHSTLRNSSFTVKGSITDRLNLMANGLSLYLLDLTFFTKYYFTYNFTRRDRQLLSGYKYLFWNNSNLQRAIKEHFAPKRLEIVIRFPENNGVRSFIDFAIKQKEISSSYSIRPSPRSRSGSNASVIIITFI